MSRPFFYCSDLSRLTAETSFGTASIGEVWLLLEYREAWGTHALQDSSLSAQLKSYLNKLCQTIPRSRLCSLNKSAPPCRRSPATSSVAANARRQS
jgi:hypothetical protein